MRNRVEGFRSFISLYQFGSSSQSLWPSHQWLSFTRVMGTKSMSAQCENVIFFLEPRNLWMNHVFHQLTTDWGQWDGSVIFWQVSGSFLCKANILASSQSSGNSPEDKGLVEDVCEDWSKFIAWPFQYTRWYVFPAQNLCHSHGYLWWLYFRSIGLMW